jgi:protein-tyrosine-phosphatase
MDMLFVCSGNTCRSPMAQCLFNDLCKKRGLPHRAESAGMYAREGDVATDGAFEAMKERGLSLARHAARPLTPMIIRDARLVVAMGENLAQAIRQKYPNARVIAFQPPISDPYGGSLAVYRATADELCSRMDWVLKQLESLKEQP